MVIPYVRKYSSYRVSALLKNKDDNIEVNLLKNYLDTG